MTATKAPVCAGNIHTKFARTYGLFIPLETPLTDVFDTIVDSNGHPQLKKIKALHKRKTLHQAASIPVYGKNWFEKYCYKRFKQYAPKAQKKMERAACRRANRKAEVKQLWDFFYSIPAESVHVIGGLPASHFYKSKEWTKFRYMFISCFGARCMACGATATRDGAQIDVDHIYPRHLFPELAFRPDNLQTLCSSCHAGKGAKFGDSWGKYAPKARGAV